MARKRDKMPARNKKNFRPTKAGAGMTKAGVAAYRRKNPGSKLKTAVTGKVKPGSKDAKRRKSFCARSAGQMKKSKGMARGGKTKGGAKGGAMTLASIRSAAKAKGYKLVKA